MSVFNRDMSIEVLRNGLGILKIPEGITELSVDFALVFDWIPEKKCQCSFREIQLPSSIQKINGVYLTEYGPDETPIKRFKRISVSKDNPYYTDVDGVLFSKDMTRLICYPCGKTGHTYIVPDSVEVIGEFAFGNNINLKKIVLPNSLKRIEYQAFFQCENLSVINLPYGLEYIGEECFALSTSLNRLIVPLTVKHIPTSLFYEGSIVSVPNPEIELVYDLVPTEYLNMPFNGPAILSSQNDELVDFAESYDYNHFENCYEDKDGIIWTNHGKTLVCFPVEWASEEYELPDEVREVYINAFRGCSLKRFYSRHKILIVGRTVSTPRYYEPMSGRKFHITAFELFCDDDKDTNIQNDIQNNDAPPYSIDCQSTPFADTLEEEEAKNLCVDENGHIDIPEHIRIIGNHAFNCRKDIVSVTLPDGLITIKDSAFNACHNLEKINIPQSVLLIEDDAFARCFKLDHISLPDGIECIHSGTFQHCSSLRHITVSAALKSIDRIAFLYCYKLKEIILPDTVKYIYEDAFDGCNDLSIISPVGSFARKFADMHGFNKDCAVISQNISDNIKDSNTMGYAFISYSTKNQQMADSFKTLFNQNNIKTWMAPGDIPFGSTYTSTINSAIRGASCFVLLLSESAQGSQWVLRETERAVSTGKTIFTVLLDDVPMNDDFEFMLSASQAVAIRKIDTNDENIQRLLMTVQAFTNKKKEHLQQFDGNHRNKEERASEHADKGLDTKRKEPSEEKTAIDTSETIIEFSHGKLILNNRYELGNIIGDGGFGTVYKAKDLMNRNDLVVKVSKCSIKSIIDLHKFLIDKTNDNLCKIYDAAFFSNGEAYIAMEWIKDSKSLDQIGNYHEFHDNNGENYPSGYHVFVLIDILKGLKCLHDNGIIHADIKPSNIMTDGLVTKLIDYSSAFFISTGRVVDIEHTYIDHEYRCPEHERALDARSDLYSVGMVAFRWFTGKSPMLDELGHLICDNEEMDEEFIVILKKATAPKPKDRYQNADEFIYDLKNYCMSLLKD